MTDEELRVPGIDATRPSVARVYDFWLGGKENFAVDREMGGRMAGVCEAGRWVAGIGGVPAARPAYALAAAAVKTGG